MNQFEMKDALYSEREETGPPSPTSLDKIKRKIFWEANSAVRQNRNIDHKQILAKTQTHKFPEGVTVRTHSIRNKVTSAYFFAASSGVIDSKLIVTFPVTSRFNGKDYSYSLNGNMPKDMTFTEMGQILEYINRELKDMYGK